MAKTSTVSTIPPNQFTTGREVFYEDAKAVAEMLNWAIDKRPVVHVSMNTGIEDWNGGGKLATLGSRFNTASGWNTRFVFKITVQSETTNITIAARCFMAAANEGQVRFTVGAAAASTLTTFTNATNGTEHSATVATSSSGTGDLTVTIECNHTVGADADCYIRNFRVEEQIIGATNLPDPADA